MKKTIQDLQIRIDKLTAKDPVGNSNLISKLKRRIRAMENKET